MQKQQEAVPYEQSRQPRRGGTGGEELRRLRWSSPPGQVEQVPRGFSSPPPPFGHHSGRDSQRRHVRAQAKAGTGRERRLPPIIIRSRKVLGGLGDSFKSPPAHPSIPVSPSPPVRHGDGGRGRRSRRSGRRRGGGRRRRCPRGQRRGGRGTGRSRPCRRG